MACRFLVTSLHNQVVLDFETLIEREQLLYDLSHISGDCLELLLNDVFAALNVDVVLLIVITAYFVIVI